MMALRKYTILDSSIDLMLENIRYYRALKLKPCEFMDLPHTSRDRVTRTMNKIKKEVLFFDSDWPGRYMFMVSITPGSFRAWMSPKVERFPHRHGGYNHPAEILLLKILTGVDQNIPPCIISKSTIRGVA